LTARLVIDARGGFPLDGPCGWQTFVGQDLELAAGHGLQRPILMDATVAQTGGYRFVYVLPWSPTRLLVEDTVYTDDAGLNPAEYRQRIDEYVRAQGWRVRSIVREEHGALPIPLGGDGPMDQTDGVTRIGVRAGLFHPTTGYSLPDAAATADLLASLDLGDSAGVQRTLSAMAQERWRARGFFRLLNRLLFRAADPHRRVAVFEQFYQRPEPIVARFYAGRLSWLDRCRILSGRPPVPLSRALPHLWARAW